tara:strand:- start:239 stop:1165 length:927 start_codon:yes stop_codon:yes gene_type:complete
LILQKYGKGDQMKITRKQIRRLMLAEVLSEQSNSPTTMEDWWAGVEKDITADYKEDVSGSLSAYTEAKTVNIKYVSTGTPDASDNYPADHKFEITPKASEGSPQGSFNEMVKEKIDQHSEQAGDAFWVSMANKYGDFNFEYKPAKPDASAGRNLNMDTGDAGTGMNEVKRIKITKRQLRKLVLEAFETFSDDDRRVTGVNIMLPFYEESHEMWRGGFAGDLDFSDLNFEENAIRQFAEALIAHPDSQLEPQEEAQALQDFENALKGNNTEFFAPKFDDGDDIDYDGDYNHEPNPYDTVGNFGPDMFSR